MGRWKLDSNTERLDRYLLPKKYCQGYVSLFAGYKWRVKKRLSWLAIRIKIEVACGVKLLKLKNLKPKEACIAKKRLLRC